jgi:formylglycine-generating enzyme required for sulfatase activity
LAILVIVLSGQPIRRQLLKWRAQRLGELVPIEYAVVRLGDAKLYSRGFAASEQVYTIEPFYIEKYEVTNERYLLCMQANVCSPPSASPTEYTTPDRYRYPVTNITAIQASQFCAWIGRRLPTASEWELAARSPAGWHWPWGDEPDPETFDRAYFSYEEYNALPVQETGLTHAGQSPEGVYDLAGNAWEWTCTPYTNTMICPDECINLTVEFSEAITVKGGGGYTEPDEIGKTMAYHSRWMTTSPESFIGFRCVKKP